MTTPDATTDSALKAWLDPLHVSFDTLCNLATDLARTYNHLALTSHDQFLATPVIRLPTGEERGEFLSIDLGGSNLRVAFVSLLGSRPIHGRRKSLDAYDERIEKYHDRSWPIGDNLKHEKAEDLFSWIGDCLAEVIRARLDDVEELPEEIPLGITFSFPMMQSTLSEATLLPMGKGFSITSNPDLGSMVMKGYERHTTTRTKPLPRIKLVAIANDAVATLISLSYTTRQRPNSKAVVGLIMGTGCNMSVPMKPEQLHPDKVAFAANGQSIDEIVVNTECTLSGVGPTLRGHGLFTSWDERQDAALPTPGFQPFEYMTAGAYLGEIVRLTVNDYFVNHLNIEEASLPPTLVHRNALTTTFLGHTVAITENASALAADLNNSNELGCTANFTWTSDLAQVLISAERAVLRRSTQLTAAAIIGVMFSIGEITPKKDRSYRGGEHIGQRSLANQPSENPDRVESSGREPQTDMATSTSALTRELVVAYCGGLICLYHGYRDRTLELINQLLDVIVSPEDNVKIILREASEGGVIGAGVLAGTVWPLRGE